MKKIFAWNYKQTKEYKIKSYQKKMAWTAMFFLLFQFVIPLSTTAEENYTASTTTEKKRLLVLGASSGNITGLGYGSWDWFDAGTVVTLSATPGIDEIFIGWGGPDINCRGTGQCVVTMDSHITVYASFVSTATTTYDNSIIGITTGVNLNEFVRPTTSALLFPSEFCFSAENCGHSLSLYSNNIHSLSNIYSLTVNAPVIQANSGYTFNGFTGTGCALNSCTFTNPSGINSFFADLSYNPSLDTLNSSLSIPNPQSDIGTSNTMISLYSGYSSEPALLSVEYGPTTAYGYTVETGSVINPYPFYATEWNYNFMLPESLSEYYFRFKLTDQAGNTSYSSQYYYLDESQPATYTLTTSVSPTGGGTVAKSPNQASYDEGTTVTVSATPSSGYTFSAWSNCSTSTSNQISVLMDANKTCVANFTATSPGDSHITPDNIHHIDQATGVEFFLNGSLPAGVTGVNFTVQLITQSANSGATPSGKNLLKSYSIVATDQNGNPLSGNFTFDIVLPFSFTQELQGSNISVLYWDGSKWSEQGISGIYADKSANEIWFTTNHFTEFGVFGETSDSTEDDNTLVGSIAKSGISLMNLFGFNLLIALALMFLMSGIIGRTRFAYLVK